MKIPIYQIDAFTRTRFGGNPAAVCALETWPLDSVLQAIAAENNLSETAFFVTENDGYRLRWFTPREEVELCGHATLATAHVLFGQHEEWDEVRFDTLSGPLVARRRRDRGDVIELDFPAIDLEPSRIDRGFLASALGTGPAEVYIDAIGRDLVAIYDRDKEVAALEPDFGRMAAIGYPAVMAAAPCRDPKADYVCRFFAPRLGIPEDSVTGSAQCRLAPFFARKLGRETLRGRQISERGGEFECDVAGDRVKIRGHAVTYLEGTIEV